MINQSQPPKAQKFKKTIQIHFLVLLSLFLFNPSFAQIKVSGMVKDSLTLKPIEYLTVSLLKNDASKTIAANSFTDTTGKFTLLADTGNYLLSLNQFGYARHVQNIKIYAGMPTDLKLFLLKPEASNLKEVVITGFKPLIEQDRDKLVYNVEQDPVAKTENATDIFRKVPMLSVDGEGNVQMNGQNNFKVLLNGRETAMFAQNVKDALRGFPGAVISKIEVITSPSAKYDAEGIGGVINIITKKAIVGYNGYLSAYYSNINYTASTNFSARSGKLAITGTYFLSGSYHNRNRISSETVPLLSAPYVRRFLDGERISNRFSNTGNLEISYNLDSLHTLVAYGNINGGNSRNRFEQDVTTTFSSGPEQHDLFNQQVRSSFPTFGIGADFIKKFKHNTDKELSFRFNRQFSEIDGTNNSSLYALDDLFLQNTSLSKNTEYTIQGDFIQPFSKNLKLETGAKLILRSAESDYTSSFSMAENQPFEPNLANTDRFAYQQQVYSGYGTLSFSIRQFNFRTGARVEHTVLEGDFLSSNTKVNQKYTSLIPDFSFNTRLGQSYTIVLGYTKRLQRPYINTLNPFINNNDPLNISFGNPELNAQTIHAVSLQNRWVKGSNFASLTLGSSYSGNMIVQYTNFDQQTGVATTRYGNFGRNREVNVALSLSTVIAKKINGGFSGTLRYNKIENKMIETQQEQGFSGLVSAYIYYRPTKNFTLSGSGGINRQSYSLINTAKANPFYQMNIGYKFFNQKLSTSVNFNNFFNKWFTAETITNDANFINNTRNTFPFRVIYAGFTYNFGKLKENLSKKKGVNNDDLIN